MSMAAVLQRASGVIRAYKLAQQEEAKHPSVALARRARQILMDDREHSPAARAWAIETAGRAGDVDAIAAEEQRVIRALEMPLTARELSLGAQQWS